MHHPPVCSPCCREMHPFKNAVGVLDYAGFGPYQLWEADEWACPKCGHKVVVGFGANPISHHFEEGFAKMVQVARDAGILREVRDGSVES